MTIFGPDISNNNGVVDIDRVVAEGSSFVFAKVSEGAFFGDRFWPRTRDWCAATGLICVGYHYVRTDDPDHQATMFANNGGGTRVMFDVEVNSGDINNYWACVQAFNRRGIEVVLTYLPHWYWLQISRPDLSNVPGLLISSNYTTYSDDGPGWTPYGGRTPDLWQYTDKQPIAGMSLDANAYRGTKQQLADALAGLGPGLLIPDVEGILLP